MMLAISDKEPRPILEEGTRTPSFAANSPSPSIPPSAVTISAIIADLLDDSTSNSKSRSKKTYKVDDIPLPDDLDLSSPISDLLREGTKRAHIKAEHSGGAAALTAGHLDLQEYVRWLAILWRVYDVLELGISEHATNPVLAPTFDPSLLARAPALAEDINFLLHRLPSAASTLATYKPPSTTPSRSTRSSTPLPPFPLPPFLRPIFTEPPAPLTTYLDHLRTLASSVTTARSLLAHAYVRYLGDLSGGQIIGARIGKAYGLPALDGRKFYHFNFSGEKSLDAAGEEAGAETGAERKRMLKEVKDWYRNGMNEGVADDTELKAHLIKEANVAFALNTHLFSLIRTPAAGKDAVSTVNADGKELRYYERQELERKAKLAQPRKPLTMADMAENLVWAVVAVAVAAAFTQYGLPVIKSYAEPWLRDVAWPWWRDVAAPKLQRHMERQRMKPKMF